MFIAFNKLFVMMVLCLAFIRLFGVSIYAESNEVFIGEYNKATPSEEEIKAFDYSDKYLVELVNINEENLFTNSHFSSYDVNLYHGSSLKDLGALQLSTGFDRERISTFATSKAIVGVGKENTVVGLHVFHFDADSNGNNKAEDLVSTQNRTITLGKSGLYNETVRFDYVGVNYVLLATKDPVTFTTTKRLYKVTLKELETRNKLENMTINFFQEVESPSIEGFVPEIVEFGF